LRAGDRRTEVAVAVADADDGGVRAANRNDRWRGVRGRGRAVRREPCRSPGHGTGHGRCVRTWKVCR
jgi:hypothetical protein